MLYTILLDQQTDLTLLHTPSFVPALSIGEDRRDMLWGGMNASDLSTHMQMDFVDFLLVQLLPPTTLLQGSVGTVGTVGTVGRQRRLGSARRTRY
jgi:hypothetical protein